MGSSRPKIREEAGLQKLFSALRASVWSKTMGGEGRVSPGSATETNV